MAAARTATLEIQLITDIMRLQKDMQSVQRAVGTATSSASASAAKMGQSFEKAAGTITTAFRTIGAAAAAAGLGALAANIIKVNATFQSLEASLKVATGSIQAAGQAMGQLKAFAAETPFTLEQTVQAFLKLKNLGLEASVESMRSYGNTAASMGKDIMQMIEAVADATTGEFERLKEFGIKASTEGEKVSFTFQGVTTTVQKSAADIAKYLVDIGNTKFGSAMAEQMKTLNGQWSNLQDNLDALYVSIGKLGANSALSELMGGASTAVLFLSQNLDTIINVLGAAGIAWGVYTAATIAGSVAQTAMSGTLGVFMALVATTTAELGVLAGAEVAATGATSALATSFNGLTAAMARNPFGLIAVALAAVAAALFLTRQRTDELNVAQVSQSRTSKVLDTITADVARTQGTLATATGKARAESLAHIQALKAEAEKLLQVATAASLAAEAKAYAAEKTAKAALAEEQSMKAAVQRAGAMAGVVVDDNPLPSDKRSAAEESFNKLRAAADAAGKDFRETTARVAALRGQIEAATKPINVASAATGKLAGAARDAAKAVDEFGKSFGPELINNLAAYSQAIAEGFGKPFLEGQDAEFQKFIDKVNEAGAAGVKSGQEAAEATAAWSEQVREAVRALDQLGGKASGLADIAAIFDGFKTGDFSGVSGAAGYLAKQLGRAEFTKIDPKSGQEIATTLGKEFSSVLDGVFGQGGSFAQMLENAGSGYAAGSLVNGAGNSGLGSMIGGVLGGEFGKLAGPAIAKGIGGSLGKALGSAAGPLGAIAGGIIAGALGGLFKKTPTGSVILGQGGVLGTSGNGGRDATGLGKSVFDALFKISDVLGVAASGRFSTSIGMRGDSYRVDTTGAGRTKESDVLNFGADAEAAVKAAVRDAISDGVFEGLSEGTKKFLLTGDLETQLAKFADYQSAIKAADAKADPMGAELASIADARNHIIGIANELGASLEEINKLEAYYAGQRQEIVEKYDQEWLDAQRTAYETRRTLEIQIMELEGRTIEARDAARRLELSGVEASLQPLYERIYALQDEATATAAAKVIADERYGLEGKLLQLQGDTAALRQRELDALNPANRALQEYIWSLEDAATAATKAAEIEKQRAQLMLSSGSMAKGDLSGIASGGYGATARNWAEVEAGFAAGGTTLIGGLIQDILSRDNNLAFTAKYQADRAAYIGGFDPSLQDQAGRDFDMQRQLSVYNEASGAAFGAGAGGGRDISGAMWTVTPEEFHALLTDGWERWARVLKGGSGDPTSDAANDNAAIQETIDQFEQLSDALRKFRDDLFTTEFSQARNFGSLRAQYNQTAALAQQGDAAALAGLPDIARRYLDAAKMQSASRMDYEAIVGGVIDNTNAAIGASDSILELNQKMLDRQTRIADGIDGLRDEVKALREETRTGNASQRKTADALTDASRGGVLNVKVAG